MMDEGDYLEEKQYKVSFTNILTASNPVESINIFALDEKEAEERISSEYREVLSVKPVTNA